MSAEHVVTGNPLIVFYSLTGNNNVLARHLAVRLGAPTAEVRETRRRTQWNAPLDLMFKREPAIHPLDADVSAHSEVLLLAPLWDMNVAMPMVSAMRQLRGSVQRYSFVSLCGYDRPGQLDHVRAELTERMGAPPQHLAQLLVGDLFAPQDRNKVWLISARQVRAADLGRYARQIDQIVGWYA